MGVTCTGVAAIIWIQDTMAALHTSTHSSMASLTLISMDTNCKRIAYLQTLNFKIITYLEKRTTHL